MRRSLLALGTALALSACNLVGYGEKAPLVPQDPARADADTLHPDLWPAAKSGVTRDPAIEAKVAKLVKEMTVEEKVGQILQADWDSVTPEGRQEISPRLDARRRQFGAAQQRPRARAGVAEDAGRVLCGIDGCGGRPAGDSRDLGIGRGPR